MSDNNRHKTVQATIICLLALFLCVTQFGTSFSQGPNNRNVSVDTQVNITGSIPEVLNVFIQDPITLSPAGLRFVTCNATIRDFNGFADIDTVNATLFHSTSSYGAADDNNTHYQNNSCSVIVGQEDGGFANYTCGFELTYYALNGSWNCTVWVNDSIGLNSSGSNLTNINALLALNVTTLIDYGQMTMGDTSTDQEANVSNIGNVPIKVSVEGYARNISDGLSMVCEQGNLSVGLQHFAGNSTASYAEKQVLTSDPQNVSNFVVAKAVNDSGELNETYWQLFLDTAENAFGICNGTVIFQAELN